MRLPSYNAVTFPYGATSAPYSPSNPHAGTDYGWSPDPHGYAVEPLVITRVGWLGSAGYSLDARSIDGSRTYRYCHCEDGQIYVSVGQQVDEGYKLHKMGETGQAFGVHLHFVMWLNGNRIDGDAYIRGQSNQGGSNMTNDDSARQIGFNYLGRNGYDGRPNALASPQPDLQNQPLTNAKLQEWFLSAEASQWRDVQLPKVYADRDKYKNELAKAQADLVLVTKQRDDAITAKNEAEVKVANLEATNASLRAENDALKAENEALKKRVAELEAGSGDVTINFNFIGNLLFSIIKIVGLKK